VFVTIVANKQFGVLGVEGRIVLRRALNRNDSKLFGVPQDGISDNPQNDNRKQTTEKYEQTIGSHVLQTEDIACCEEIACKDLFRQTLHLE
jgi:hypothetical protein